MGLWLPECRARLYKGRSSSVALKVMFTTVGLFNLKKKKKKGYKMQGDETVSLISFIFVEEEVLLERFSHQQVNGLL